MVEEIQQIKPKKDYKIHLAVFLIFFITSVIVGGAVFFYGAMQNIGMQKYINVLKGEIIELKSKNDNLLKQLKENKKIATTTLIGTDTINNEWIEINRNNFWNNPNKVSGGDYKFPDISFSYPKDWIFNCCGDTDSFSGHFIYPNEKKDYYISITDYSLLDCPSQKENCSITERVGYNSEEKYNIVKNRLQENSILVGEETISNFPNTTIFKSVDDNNAISLHYLLNSGDGVLKITFTNVEKFPENFIEKFINKIIDNETAVLPDCQDGFTYMSYYPNPDGSIEFPGDFLPSEELKKIRVAYYTFFACSESDEEGYYIKQNEEFKKVEKDEFDKFIEDYNANCNDCLTEHFDGCC